MTSCGHENDASEGNQGPRKADEGKGHAHNGFIFKVGVIVRVGGHRVPLKRSGFSRASHGHHAVVCGDGQGAQTPDFAFHELIEVGHIVAVGRLKTEGITHVFRP